MDCRILRQVILPKSIEFIGSDTFHNCVMLKSVNLQDLNTSDYKTLYSDMFCKCSSLEEIIIPDGITDLGIGCFADCTQLRSVKLPDSIEVINDYCFKGCVLLDEINIPKRLKFCSSTAFYGCRGYISSEFKRFICR